MSQGYQEAILTVAGEYRQAVARRGGRSLARVATIVANRGAFFDRLIDGASFSVRNLEKFAEWFRSPGNWPDQRVPPVAADALASIGRPIHERVATPKRAGTCDHPPAFHKDAA